MARVVALTAVLSLTFTACSIFHQPSEEESPIFSRIFKTDYNTAWQAVLEAMKGFDNHIVNREAGVIQTSWMDNTERKAFAETYGESSEAFKKAKYRLSVTVSPGIFRGRSAIKISIQKEQLVQRDVLESWAPVKTDKIEENTFLYRVGRVVFIKEKLRHIEEEKTRRAFEEG